MVTVISNPAKPGVAEALAKVVNWLKKHNIAFVLPKAEAEQFGLAEAGVETAVLFKDSKYVLAIGGDGTTLRALRMMGKQLLPLLGINLGKVGFLMEVPPQAIETALQKLFTHKYHLDLRSLLEVEVQFQDNSKTSRFALNDVAIGRDEFGRLLKIAVYINNWHFTDYAADGVVVATPTGSTAFSFSAGGPFISPASEVFVLTPICPHSLFNRSLVFSDKEELLFKPQADGGLAKVTVDGQLLAGKPVTVRVRLAKEKFPFISIWGQTLSLQLSKAIFHPPLPGACKIQAPQNMSSKQKQDNN
jgi:NAD+ kinase